MSDLLNVEIVHMYEQVRLVSPDAEQLGITSSKDALRMAEDLGLDLFLVTDKSTPPVCKILDYGKYRYAVDKKEKTFRKAQRESRQETKEIQLRAVTDTHDLEIKARACSKFLAQGDKVNVVLKMKGRERSRADVGFQTMETFLALVADGQVESPAKFNGSNISVLLSPTKG